MTLFPLATLNTIIPLFIDPANKKAKKILAPFYAVNITTVGCTIAYKNGIKNRRIAQTITASLVTQKSTYLKLPA